MPSSQIQTYARIAGALLLVSLLAGGFGEFYVPNMLIVSGDATATAHNIVAFKPLLRLSFAAYLIEATCDVALSLLMYVLLKPVQKEVALLAGFFGLVSTAVFAGGELFYFGGAILIQGGAGYLKTFSPAQLDSLTLLSIRFYAYGTGIFMSFYGIAVALRGYLIYRSSFLPKIIGALLMLAGFGFIAKNFTLVLAPAYSSDLFILPMMVGALALTVWLLVKGVNLEKWSVANDATR
jgi:hypothetical protein